MYYSFGTLCRLTYLLLLSPIKNTPWIWIYILVISTLYQRYIMTINVCVPCLLQSQDFCERSSKNLSFADLLAPFLTRELRLLQHTVLAAPPPQIEPDSQEALPAVALSTVSPGSGALPRTTARLPHPACPMKPHHCRRLEAEAPLIFLVN